MGNYEELKQAISDVIKTNGNQEITGQIMQNALLSIISTVGNNATFAGIASPDTNPGTPDQNIFYIASVPHNYVNFNNIKVLPGEVAFFINKNGVWTKQNVGIGSYSGIVDASMGCSLPCDDYVSRGGGLNEEYNNILNFDPQKNGWYINNTTGTKSDGQHLYAMRDVPVYYDEKLPYIVTCEMIIAYKPSVNFKIDGCVKLSNRAGVVVGTYNLIAQGIDQNENGYSRILYKQSINLKQISDESLGKINSGSYILVSQYVQFPVLEATNIPDGLELYVENRKITMSGFEDRDYNTYTERKALIQGNGITLPFAVTNVGYKDSNNSNLNYGNATNGMKIEPGENWKDGNITFDVNIPIIQKWNDEFGKAFYLRVKFGGDNIFFENEITGNLDDYFVNGNFNDIITSLQYVIPGTMEYVISCYAKSTGNVRVLLPANVSIIDKSRTALIKLQSITLMQYNADMIERTYENWEEAIALNDGNPISVIDDWERNNSRFPLKVLFDGEGFYGAENNRAIGRLFIPRRIKQLNPNYIAAKINKDIFKSIARVGGEYIENGNKTIYVSWYVMYKIKGHGLNNKDDYYYNSSEFIGENATFTGTANANGGATLASGKVVYFLPKDFVLKGGEPFFIVNYEYHFDVNAIIHNDGDIQMFAMMQNDNVIIENCQFDIEVQSLSAWCKGLDFPFVDNSLSRSVEYSQYADQTINIPNNIGFSSGEVTCPLTETRGMLLEGDTGTADKTAPAIVGYISVNEVAQNDGAITAININSPVAQTVDLVVGLIDQNNIIVPGVSVENVELVEGENIIGYYNAEQSPLPIKSGERLFIKQKTANVIPYMEKIGASYVYADNISNPTVTTVEDRQLDFRYIIQYNKKPRHEIPTRAEFKELSERVDEISGQRDAIPVYSPNGSKWYIRVNDDGTVYADRNTFSKLCIIGNSITWHGIADYWWGTWGMAATVREKDYAHLILDQAKKGNPDCTLDYFNFAEWETATTSQERAELLPQVLDSHLDLNPDCVIIRLCENVQPAGTPTLQQDYQTMLQYIKSKVPDAKIYCGGSFWSAPDKDYRIKAACDAEGVSFSYQSQLDNPENRSAIGTQVYGDDGQLHTINNSGVASHPGDKGMQAIANVFINQMGI